MEKKILLHKNTVEKRFVKIHSIFFQKYSKGKTTKFSYKYIKNSQWGSIEFVVVCNLTKTTKTTKKWKRKKKRKCYGKLKKWKGQ